MTSESTLMRRHLGVFSTVSQIAMAFWCCRAELGVSMVGCVTADEPLR